MSAENVLSVGIDIGTSTTQVIFSDLTMNNTASYFSVPHVSITAKKVVYKSDIYTTPLKTPELIDADGVKEIVQREFDKAGYTPADTDTGAVIITGESARKENAAAVLEKLSGFAGDFVVSTAGPDLESVIAGKGSGAAAYSLDNSVSVLNLDIGGGTTNIVMFDCGSVVAKGCVDIGGRLIKTDASGVITYISPAAAAFARDVGVSIRRGDRARESELAKVTDRMSALLENMISSQPDEILRDVITPGSSPLVLPKKPDVICFSGGVADFVYSAQTGSFKYGDIGEILGRSIRSGRIFSEHRVINAGETIRATVVGAGTYTTSVSGSTINYSADILPIKNAPVLFFGEKEQKRIFESDSNFLRKKVRWFMEQSDSELFILAMKGLSDPSYEEIKAAAQTICEVLDEELPRTQPIIIVLENDMAKALGQAMKRLGTKRNIICIDSIKAEENDFIDMGKPLMNGLVIPVVVKTLIFN